MQNTADVKTSIAISFATQYVELIIHFFGVLILARLLSPEEIGTFSVAAFLMALLHVFRDFGVVQYIIQEDDLTSEKIRSAMGVGIVLALVVALVLLASSGLVAKFYGHPEIKQILEVMAASFAISPFGSLLIGVLRRKVELKKIFFITMGSALCHVTVGIFLAKNGFGAVSLAWANFAGILSFGFLANTMRPKDMPWVPRFKNSKTILSFGSISSLGNAANIAGSNMPDLVIAKVMDMAAVGYFSRANGLIQLFTRLITSALLPLVLPHFAQMRRQGRDLAAPYLSAVECLTALSLPFFASMMLLAYPLIRALYGAQWDASVPIVELLCVAGAISSISLFASQVMVANGKVRDSTYSQLLTQPFRIGFIFIASTYGLRSVAIGLILSEIVILTVVSWYLHKTIKVSPGELVRACGKSVLVASATAAVPLCIRLFWLGTQSNPWLPLSIGLVGAILGWIGAMLLTRHPLAAHLIPLVRPLYSR